MDLSADIDLFGDAVLADPYPAYAELRERGSAVWLDKQQVWFLGRFEDVRMALSDWQRFSSDKGIGLNAVINQAWDEALICQDPPAHTERRKFIAEVLSPAALKPVADTINARAEDLAARLVQMGEFDGVTDFAHDLPVGVVMDLIGWPLDVRPRLLELAAGSWNAAGPENARMAEGLGQLEEMVALVTEIYDNNRVTEGGFAAQLIGAAHAGHITRETAIGMLMGYIVAAFETTISAMAAGLHLFATNPDQWDKLRAQPNLVAAAANEIVRMESPLQNFSRWVTGDVELSDGTILPANSRAVVSYAAANRDPRRFEDPDAFRIDRAGKAHLGFGAGPHMCAGQGLARMELVAVFSALLGMVERFELTGEPHRALNNISRSFARLPMRVVAA